MVTKYTKELLEPLVKDSLSIAEVMRKLGFATYSGGHSNWIRSRIDYFGIDRSHFLGLRIQSVRRGNGTIPKEKVLVKSTNRGRTTQLRRCLLESGVKPQCAECLVGTTWNHKPLVLQIDHIDGDPTNHVLENLRFLCPNCHSQTTNWGFKSAAKR